MTRSQHCNVNRTTFDPGRSGLEWRWMSIYCLSDDEQSLLQYAPLFFFYVPSLLHQCDAFFPRPKALFSPSIAHIDTMWKESGNHIPLAWCIQKGLPHLKRWSMQCDESKKRGTQYTNSLDARCVKIRMANEKCPFLQDTQPKRRAPKHKTSNSISQNRNSC